MIGLYIVRVSDSGSPVSLAHLVESEVANRKVVRCGKELPLRNKGGALRMAGPTDRTCYWCAYKTQKGTNFIGEVPIEDVPEPIATEHDDTRWSPV